MGKEYLFILLILFLGITNCDFLSSNNQLLIHIQTDKNHYNFNTDDSVEVTITNKSHRTIHYSTCLSKTLELIKDDKTIQTSGLPVCDCICPAELKPGESMPIHISSVSVEAFQFQADHHVSKEAVLYRIKYSLYFDEAFSDNPLPSEYSRSNTFTITGVEQ